MNAFEFEDGEFTHKAKLYDNRIGETETDANKVELTLMRAGVPRKLFTACSDTSQIISI